MSQEKVDRYKSEKANRKETLKKKKYKSIIGSICGIALLIAVVGWGGYSAYHRYETSKPTNYIDVDTTAINDYQNSLSTD